jgi:P27 family predicted phage terminase small subunit
MFRPSMIGPANFAGQRVFLKGVAVGKRGPAPRPTHLRALEGAAEGRLNRDEPVPSDVAAIVPPAELEENAQAVWNRLAPDLIAKRVLTVWDVDLFAAFCRSVALYNRAAAEVEGLPLKVAGSHGGTVINPTIRVMQSALDMMRTTGQRFGLTPGDRAQLKVDGGGGSKRGAERLLG